MSDYHDEKWLSGKEQQFEAVSLNNPNHHSATGVLLTPAMVID